jgi:hypothetical protein
MAIEALIVAQIIIMGIGLGLRIYRFYKQSTCCYEGHEMEEKNGYVRVKEE